MWTGAMAHEIRQQRCFKLLKSQSLSYDLLNAPSERFVSCPLWQICFNKYGKSKAMKYKINNKEIRLKSKNHNRWWWRAFSSPSLPQELARLVLFLITITIIHHHYHHPNRRHHHPCHRHKDLHQIESTSSGFPDWSKALRTPLPSCCWRQPRCSLSFLSFPSSFRSSRSQAIAIQSSSGWLNLENLASKVDAAVSLLWTKVLPLNSSFLTTPKPCRNSIIFRRLLYMPTSFFTYNWRHDFCSTPSTRWLCGHLWWAATMAMPMIVSMFHWWNDIEFFLHPHRPFSSQGRQPSLSQVRGPWDLGLLCLSADHPDFVRQVLTSNSILTVFKILSLGC